MTEAAALMPMTLALALTNIDATKVHDADVRDAIHAGRGQRPLIPSGFLEVNPIANGHSWYVNHAGTADLGRIDPTDPVARSRAECWSRRQALQMVQALRDSEDPALGDIEWIASGPQVGVRESRRVKGGYVLTEADALAGRRFEDTIVWRSGFFDPGGQAGARFGRMKIHDVPYRALVPETLDGLLMAGRCLSATHAGAMAGKSMGNCLATGHAAGVAAALAVSRGVSPRELPVAAVQAALRADGVDLDLEDRDQVDL
jgi:hypothetical protein